MRPNAACAVLALALLALPGGLTAQDTMAKDAMEKDKSMEKGKSMDKDKMMGKEMAMAMSGTFSGAAGHKAHGTFSLTGSTLEIADGFEVEKAPDIYVVLSKGSTVAEGTSLNLGKLRSLKGRQSYAVPAAAGSAGYDTVVLWCKKYNVNMGTGAITGMTDHGAMMGDKAMMEKDKMEKDKMEKDKMTKKN
jgi:pentapeptide MXKDX repeat protein